jgi:hypothetical protein
MNPVVGMFPFLLKWRGMGRLLPEFDSYVGELVQQLMARRKPPPPHTLAARMLGCVDPATGTLPVPLRQTAVVPFQTFLACAA